jgi:hypothetical protein
LTAADLEAVDARAQLGRDEHEIEARFAREREAERAVLAGDDLVTVLGQATLENPAISRVVVDDEHSAHGTPLRIERKGRGFVRGERFPGWKESAPRRRAGRPDLSEVLAEESASQRSSGGR